MLSQKDIEMMKEWRKELVHNRLEPITMITQTFEEDWLTGEEISTETLLEVQSVVTERTSRTASELVLMDGGEFREGDLWFSVSIDELTRVGLSSTEDFDGIGYVLHKDRRYRVTAWDRKGIGEPNRLEFLGKVVK